MPDLPDDRRLPHPSRLSPGHPSRSRILAAHDDALRQGQPGYLDPVTGLFVMTAQQLWDRGYCCERGCRHCPFVARPATGAHLRP